MFKKRLTFSKTGLALQEKGCNLTQCILGISPARLVVLCAYITIPQGIAAALQGTNSEWNSEVVTEKHQRDDSAVHEALTHMHIKPQRSLNHRTDEASDKQDSLHRQSL